MSMVGALESLRDGLCLVEDKQGLKKVSLFEVFGDVF